ncbi:MAG: hypothetical protein PHX38_12615 [Sulfuricella sp.]|nr:hypothetical protein [Sulfuricella sp.]
MKKSICFLVGVSALSLTALSLPAMADDQAGPDIGAFGAAIPDELLAANRGGQTLEINTNNLDATLTDNQAISNITGSNLVSSGAFSSANGMNTVIQNSGNNVIIQNATILNLTLQ